MEGDLSRYCTELTSVGYSIKGGGIGVRIDFRCQTEVLDQRLDVTRNIRRRECVSSN